MIEVISEDRCIDCNLCVKVCPTNVFDAVDGGHPVIARQEDCQTCFLCEAYCPVDAMFVSPHVEPVGVGDSLADEEYLVSSGLIGLYRRSLGWNNGQVPTAKLASRAKLRSYYAAMENMPDPAKAAQSS